MRLTLLMPGQRDLTECLVDAYNQAKLSGLVRQLPISAVPLAAKLTASRALT
jgi:hypothetical protein